MIHYSPSGSQARMLVSPPPRRPSVHRFGPPMGIFFPSDRDFDPATSSATSLIPPRHMGLTVCSQSPQNLGSSVRESSASFGASQRTASAASSKPPSAPYISTSDPAAGAMVGSGGKKTTRDSKRKATHSQIERRRREKINDRLITLRNMVPACVREVACRQKARTADEEEAQRIAAGLATAIGQMGKRKRNRRRVNEAKTAAAAAQTTVGGVDKDPELGLHKLEVLTHAIEYIYELQARIQELETGVRPAQVQQADDRYEPENEENLETITDARSYVRGQATDVSLDAKTCPHDDNSDEEEDKEDKDNAKVAGGDHRASQHRDSVVDIPVVVEVEPSQATFGSGPRVDGRRSRSRSVTAGSESTTTTSSLSEDTSPIIPSVQTVSSSLSSVTNPFVSLSALSPIFMSGKSLISSGTVSASTVQSKLRLPPASMAETETAAPRDATVSPNALASALHSISARSPHGSTSAVRAGVVASTPLSGTTDLARPDDSSAAQLLLAFSSSPEEALRSQGATSPPESNASRARKRSKVGHPCETNGTMPACGRPSSIVAEPSASTVGSYFPAFATPQFRPTVGRAGTSGQYALPSHGYEQRHHGSIRPTPGSAPGGAVPTALDFLGQSSGDATRRLASPPPLALDDTDGAARDGLARPRKRSYSIVSATRGRRRSAQS